MFKKLDEYKNNVAIIEDKDYSYNEILFFSKELTSHISKRDLVIHLTSNTFESIAGYVGFIKEKIVDLLLPSDINKILLKDVIQNYKPKFLYIPISLKDEFEFKEVVRYKNYCLLKTNFDIDYKINDELALLLTTSGSTGSLKFVRQSYKNIYSNAKSIIKYLNIKSDDIAITTLPSSYTFMLSIINSHFLQGGSIVTCEYSIMQKEFWDLIKEKKVTTFSGVPFTFEMLKRLRFDRMDLESIKYITQAGGKLREDLVEYFINSCEKKDIKFIVMYGQTEATARISYLPWKNRDKIGSIGIAIPDVKIELANDGELICKGDNVTLGYSQNCYDLYKGDENKGILYTGDIAKQDKDGFFYIVGRKKRFVKIFGNRVNLDELEKIANKNGYEVVIGGNDEKIVIYSTKEYKDIIEFLSKIIKQNKKVFKLKIIDSIIRNSSGKVLYKEMEKQYGY